MLKCYLFIFCIYFAAICHQSVVGEHVHKIKAGGSLTISVSTGGTYSVGVNEDTWLLSAPTFFNADGKRYDAKRGLDLWQTTANSGSDVLGQWQAINFFYSAGQWNITASIKTYNKPDLPLVIFQQKYENGANQTKAKKNTHVVGGFPSFLLEGASNKLGYLSYGLVWTLGVWDWRSALIQYGLEGGPLCIFDKNGNAMVISPYSQFMAGSLWHEPLIGGSVSWGIMGGVDTVPPGFLYETILYFGNQGINKAFQGWGSTLKRAYGKSGSVRANDHTLKYIGYWTDGGAYYYYNPEKNKTYEETILDIKNYTDSKSIPFKYFQYDSWWYYRGSGGGVKTWTARPEIFPDGFPYVVNKVGLPAAAHNRYWASDNTYAMQNGGNYTFIVEGTKAIPTEQRFWDDLMHNATKWGLTMYEQDFLYKEFIDMNATLESVSLGRTWLVQMGEGARKSNITIQYCGPYPRFLLQSVEIPHVTQSRVSMDYRPGNKQWNIGIMSMVADAIGVAPFKDTFWSTEHQPGTHYKSDNEPFSALEALVSTLSTGPVGPSDMIGGANVSLIMKSCNKDGLILKPSRAAAAIDAELHEMAFLDGTGPIGEIWTTDTTISGMLFGIIFGVDVTARPYDITPEAAGFDYQAKQIVAFSHEYPNVPIKFSNSQPIRIQDCTRSKFCLYYVSPVIALGNTSVIIAGELDKWVPMSLQRVTNISVSDDIIVTVHVAANEVMALWFYETKLTSIQCKTTKAMAMKIIYKKGTCVPL